jgi:hypothetical protein
VSITGVAFFAASIRSGAAIEAVFDETRFSGGAGMGAFPFIFGMKTTSDMSAIKPKPK